MQQRSCRLEWTEQVALLSLARQLPKGNEAVDRERTKVAIREQTIAKMSEVLLLLHFVVLSQGHPMSRIRRSGRFNRLGMGGGTIEVRLTGSQKKAARVQAAQVLRIFD